MKLASIRSALGGLSARYLAGVMSAYAIVSQKYTEHQTKADLMRPELTIRRTLTSITTTHKSIDYGRRNTIDLISSARLKADNPSDLSMPGRYEVEIVRKSFEAIAVDLHRTIPREKLRQLVRENQ